jgi:hypothetical protein
MGEIYTISGRLFGHVQGQTFPLAGTTTIADAGGKILAGPTDVEADGSFYLSAEAGQLLVFSMRGYKDQIIKVGAADVDDFIVTLSPQGEANFWLVAAAVAAAVVVYRRKDGKVGAMTKDDLIPIFWLAGGIIGFTILRKVLIGLGIWDDPTSVKLDKEGQDPNSPWRPDFWRRSQNYSYTIDENTAKAYAKEIYDSFGMFDDCEECAIGVFRRLRTQANLSYLSDIFVQVYGEDLLTFLRGGLWPKDRLSDEDVATINDMISKLPSF